MYTQYDKVHINTPFFVLTYRCMWLIKCTLRGTPRVSWTRTPILTPILSPFIHIHLSTYIHPPIYKYPSTFTSPTPKLEALRTQSISTVGFKVGANGGDRVPMPRGEATRNAATVKTTRLTATTGPLPLPCQEHWLTATEIRHLHPFRETYLCPFLLLPNHLAVISSLWSTLNLRPRNCLP